MTKQDCIEIGTICDTQSSQFPFLKILLQCLLFVGFIPYRYQLIHQRTVRHHLFAPSLTDTLGDMDENGELRVKKFKLSPVEKLLCTSSRVDEAVVLGMLTQLKEGKFYLEDPTGAIQIDLSKAVSFPKITFHINLLQTMSCSVPSTIISHIM